MSENFGTLNSVDCSCSSGDVQPYISLALRMILDNGHRVRIATHPDFKDFVLAENKRLKGKAFHGKSVEGNLEFFDVGGDPKSLMAYMVKSELAKSVLRKLTSQIPG